MIFFSDIITACEAVKLLEKAPVAAVEVMDNASLRSMKNTSASTNQILYFPSLPPSHKPTLKVNWFFHRCVTEGIGT